MKTLKFLHRWLGLIAAVFILLFAVSGIVLNHRNFFSPLDINRNYLPGPNRYHNWNLAAVKSATYIGTDSLLVYGNIGPWLTDSLMREYTPYYTGIKEGADNRRMASVIKTPSGSILAGTMSGLYLLKNHHWHPIKLPVKEKRITGMTVTGSQVWITTRSSTIGCKKPLSGKLTGLMPPLTDASCSAITLLKPSC
ncbi:MAG: hypothetical protein ACOC4R_03065 [Bacteroidota bacterium]